MAFPNLPIPLQAAGRLARPARGSDPPLACPTATPSPSSGLRDASLRGLAAGGPAVGTRSSGGVCWWCPEPGLPPHTIWIIKKGCWVNLEFSWSPGVNWFIPFSYFCSCSSFISSFMQSFCLFLLPFSSSSFLSFSFSYFSNFLLSLFLYFKFGWYHETLLILGSAVSKGQSGVSWVLMSIF